MAIPSPVVTVTGAEPLDLATVDPAATGGLTEAEADRRLPELRRELRELHDLMMAAESHGLLVILQGMDAAGKDVTIENVITAFNPQATRVKAFKKPAGEEAKHHYLRRASAAAPMLGEVVAFDRSYYEQLLPTEANGDVDGEALERRFAHARGFEGMLQEENTIVVKLFLHMSGEVQRERLEEREQDITQSWKLSAADWANREKMDVILAGYQAAMNATATGDCPWYVVPADHRWHHNVRAAEILIERLSPYRGEWERRRDEVGEENRREAQATRR